MENPSNSKQDCNCSNGCCTPKKKSRLWKWLIFCIIILSAGTIIAAKFVGNQSSAKCCETTTVSTCCPSSTSACCQQHNPADSTSCCSQPESKLFSTPHPQDTLCVCCNCRQRGTHLLSKMQIYYVPLRSYNMTGIENIRNMLTTDQTEINHTTTVNTAQFKKLNDLINDLQTSRKRVIFTMGKGGVGKTTIAGNIARGLAAKGEKVLLTTTDPANHLAYINTKANGITVCHIDEKTVLADYQKNILDKARETMGDADLSYIEEDLRSPCTQEIAVFNAVAEIVAQADNQIVVIDTAPT